LIVIHRYHSLFCSIRYSFTDTFCTLFHLPLQDFRYRYAYAFIRGIHLFCVLFDFDTTYRLLISRFYNFHITIQPHHISPHYTSIRFASLHRRPTYTYITTSTHCFHSGIMDGIHSRLYLHLVCSLGYWCSAFRMHGRPLFTFASFTTPPLNFHSISGSILRSDLGDYLMRFDYATTTYLPFVHSTTALVHYPTLYVQIRSLISPHICILRYRVATIAFSTPRYLFAISFAYRPTYRCCSITIRFVHSIMFHSTVIHPTPRSITSLPPLPPHHHTTYHWGFHSTHHYTLLPLPVLPFTAPRCLFCSTFVIHILRVFPDPFIDSGPDTD